MVTKASESVIADASIKTGHLKDGVLSADAAGRAKMAPGFLVDIGYSRVIGADCSKGAGGLQYIIDCDAVVLHKSDGNIKTVLSPGAAITCDASTAGPAANGRDQAGALAGNWVHFYYIWNGSVLATIASTSPPPTGPTLPTGYTHWAYVTTVPHVLGALKDVRTMGSWVEFNGNTPPNSIFSNATSYTAVDGDANAFWPALAKQIKVHGRLGITSDGAGLYHYTFNFSLDGATDAITVVDKLSGLANSTAYERPLGMYVLAPVNGVIYYKWTVTAGSAQSAQFLYCGAYQVPNGG